MENINIIKDSNCQVPFEDLFKGHYSAHKVNDLENTFVVIKDKIGCKHEWLEGTTGSKVCSKCGEVENN